VKKANVSIRNLEEKIPLGIPRHRWKDKAGITHELLQ
jgi:hypothetical protein